ncbi:hypothetical protein ACP4OV_030491 [Aristida adscensionis]
MRNPLCKFRLCLCIRHGCGIQHQNGFLLQSSSSLIYKSLIIKAAERPHTIKPSHPAVGAVAATVSPTTNKVKPMAEHGDTETDATKNPATPSTSSLLPLLVFEHRITGGHGDGGEDGDGGSGDDDAPDDRMLMYSLAHQSLHEDLEHDLLLAAGSSMCWATPQGWILIVNFAAPEGDGGGDDAPTSSSAAACLWHPSTGDKLPLPGITEDELDGISQGCKCVLTHKNPTHPGCVVVLLAAGTTDMWFCRVPLAGGEAATTGGGGWTHHSYDIGNYDLPEEYRAPTKRPIGDVASLHGKLYFAVDTARDMAAVDFAAAAAAAAASPHHGRPEFRYFDVVGQDDYPEGMCSGCQWLVESHDELFLVSVCFVGFDPSDIGAVQVHKMDFSAHAWHRVRDIGDAVFLLQNMNMAASCPASPLGLQGNRVYFMKNFLEDDADLCVFDLTSETQEIIKVHEHDDQLLCRTKPFWIVPPTSS